MYCQVQNVARDWPSPSHSDLKLMLLLSRSALKRHAFLGRLLGLYFCLSVLTCFVRRGAILKVWKLCLLEELYYAFKNAIVKIGILTDRRCRQWCFQQKAPCERATHVRLDSWQTRNQTIENLIANQAKKINLMICWPFYFFRLCVCVCVQGEDR